MWVFGYGSIIWKPEFPSREQRAGYIEGWTRRFYQHSVDHRGVPGNPGRVATLVEREEGRCWGMAYEIPDEQTEAVIDQLDHRERGGYSREVVDVICPDGESGEPVVESAVMYVARRENPNWAGPAPVESLAEQIAGAEGPSGHNVEYLLELAEALREIGARDSHVFEIEEEVRRRLEGMGNRE